MFSYKTQIQFKIKFVNFIPIDFFSKFFTSKNYQSSLFFKYKVNLYLFLENKNFFIYLLFQNINFLIGKIKHHIFSQQFLFIFNILLNPIMKQPNYFEADPSFTDLSYTYAFSKYSCVSWMYPLHIIFAYCVVLTGFLAIISRVIDKIRPYHAAFGRWYLIFMFWCMASSLLIHNTGLPLPILVSFVYLLVSITIGWNAIKLHVNNLAQEVKERVNEKINLIIRNKNFDGQIDIKSLEQQEQSTILISKQFKERLFSWKMLHGLLLTFSWCQMLGRTMVTNPFTSFDNGCWTYPAYKQSVITQKVYAVDSMATPPFPMETGAFLAIITIPTVLIILVVALTSTYCFFRHESKKINENSIVTSNEQALNN